MTDLTRYILAALLVAAVSAGAFAQDQEQGPDVFFVVDNSESMLRTDPGGSRVAFAQILTDLLFSRGPCRVSVIRLGGQLESAEWNPVVLPLTRAPSDPSERDSFLELVKKSIESKSGGFGRASDFNAAFRDGVFAETRKRETPRSGILTPTVVFVISDGDMEVIEGDRAPQHYLDEAREHDGPTLRDRVNAAAMSMFRRKILPALSNPLLNTSVVPVAVGPVEDSGRFVLKYLAGTPGSGRVLRLDGSILGAVSAASNPFSGGRGPWSFVTVAAIADIAVGPAGEKPVTLEIPTESSDTRILVLGPGSEFAVGLSSGDGARLGNAEGLRVFGSLGRHRVVSCGPLPVQNHVLHIDNLSDAEAVFSVLLLCRFDLATTLELPKGPDAVRGGSALAADMSVTDARTGKVVASPWLVNRLAAVVRLVDASGEAVERTYAYRGETRARKTRSIEIPADAPAGPFVVQVAHRLLAEAGELEVAAGQAEAAVTVIPGLTAIRAEFGSTRIFRGQSVNVVARVASGNPPAGSLRIAVLGPGERDAVEIEVRWDPATGSYSGSFSPRDEGKYLICADRGDGFEIETGLNGRLEVLRRGITLKSEDGRSLDFLTFARGAGDQAGKLLPVSFIVSAELLPGELGKLTLSARPLKTASGASMVVEGSESLDLTSDNPSGKVTLRVEPGKTDSLAGEVGRIEIQGTLGGEAVRREAPLSAVAPDAAAGEEKFTDLVNRREVRIAAAAVGALALLGLIAMLTVPKFRQEHLLHENPDKRGWDEGVMLSDLRRGLSSRNAFGTPEVRNALQFRLAGRRILGTTIMARPLKPFFQFYLNDELKTAWTPLNHGDRIRIRGARFQHNYRFFLNPLTPEEFETLVPEAPAPTQAADLFDAPPHAELIIEMPTGFEDTVVSAQPDDDAFEETVVSSSAPAKSPFEELDAILGVGMNEPAEEVEPAQAAQSPATVIETRPDQGYDDQDTIFEKFFGDVAAEVKEEAAAEIEGGTDVISVAGDGTEVVGGTMEPSGGTELVSDGILSEAFTLDPDGIFSDQDITNILADVDLGDDSIVIDVPIEGGDAALEDLFSVQDEADGTDIIAEESAGDGTEVIGGAIEPGGGTELIPDSLSSADGTQTIDPELLRTEEIQPVAQADEGSVLDPELLRTDEIAPSEETVIEVEAESVEDDNAADAGGILTGLLASDDGADAFSEMRSEIDEAEYAPEAMPLGTDRVVVVDHEEFERLKRESGGK